MTQDEIIRIFHEAGELAGWKPGVGNPLVIYYMTHFAALVAAHEREKQAEQEPVAYFLDVKAGFSSKPLYEQVSDEYKNDADVFPLYAAPVRTKDLTDDEIWELSRDYGDFSWQHDTLAFARAVIAADREKNK